MNKVVNMFVSASVCFNMEFNGELIPSATLVDNRGTVILGFTDQTGRIGEKTLGCSQILYLRDSMKPMEYNEISPMRQ